MFRFLVQQKFQTLKQSMLGIENKKPIRCNTYVLSKIQDESKTPEWNGIIEQVKTEIS